MKPVARQKNGYFLPDDWILWQGERLLEAVKLSSGDHIQIEAAPLIDSEAGELHGGLSAAVWDSLERFEPLVGQLRRQLEKRALQPLTRESVLRGSGWQQLFVELTGQCNERCVHCYAESSPTRADALEWAEIRSVLEDAKDLGFGLVQLTGGDPLVSPYCIRAVELAKEIGIPSVEIYTNGLALRGDTYERLRELAPRFAFSLYSHDAEVHDAITRTPGSHARTLRAMRRAMEDDLKIRVGVISMELNRGHTSQTYGFLRALGLSEESIRFDRMRAVGRGTPMQLDAGSEPLGATGGVESPAARDFGGSAAVAYDGTVYPCIFSRHLPLGSIRETGLKAILTCPVPVAPRTRSLPMASSRWQEKLSCWQCQTRSALLEGSFGG